MKLYRHYQDYHDFEKSDKTYRELRIEAAQDDEWLP